MSDLTLAQIGKTPSSVATTHVTFAKFAIHQAIVVCVQEADREKEGEVSAA